MNQNPNDPLDFETSSYLNSNSAYSKPKKDGDATGGVIPYKNPSALIAYYLGVFSILPFIGFFTGIAAIVLGIMGFVARNKNPAIKGSIHAAIGIACGLVAILVWGAAFLFAIGIFMASPR